MPSGTTAQRPTAVTGDIRFNTTLTLFEGYNGSSWDTFGAGAPVGTVLANAGNAVPTGYLACNGAAVSRSTYADLFSICGSTYGSGDGSSTFNLPDLRGEWVRGWDAGGGSARGVDSGRGIGTFQSDQNKDHTHTISITDPGHTHDIDGAVDDADSGVYVAAGDNSGTLSNRAKSNVTGISASATDSGGDEVRVRNIALLYVIKF